MNASPSFILALLQGRIAQASYEGVEVERDGTPRLRFWVELGARIESDLAEFCPGLDVIPQSDRTLVWADVGQGEPLYVAIVWERDFRTLRVVPVSESARRSVLEASL